MGEHDGLAPEVKDRVLDAVRAELVGSGIDRFSVDRVARRAGVDPGLIRRNWHDRRVLLIDAVLARTASSVLSHDTGSLYADLEAAAALAVDNSRTAMGRALFRRLLPGDDADLAEVSSDVWNARFRDAAQILQRAADRGQLRDGIDPEEAIRMFAAAINYEVIFTDSPVRPDVGDQVVDIFLHGVLGAAGRDRPWPEVEELLRDQDAREAGAADHAVEAARRAVVLIRAWADALLDPVVLNEAVRDESGRTVDFVCRDLNRAACDEVGRSRDELVGTSLVQMLSGFEFSGLFGRYVRCVETGEPLVLNDLRYRHFDEDRVIDLRATSAGAGLLAVTWRDVTERYEEAQLGRRYGRLVSVNQAMATMLGYDITTLLTMTWMDLIAPETVADQTQVVADILAGRRDSYRAVKQYVHADGRRVWADLSLSCSRRPDGEVENVIAQMIDITELRKAGQW
jgi:PAS domain S-box-containing protein